MELAMVEAQDPKYLSSVVVEQRRLLTNCMAERDRASEERDMATNQCGKYYREAIQLNDTISRLENVVKRQKDDLQELSRKHASQVRELEAQISFLSEQVAGKRAVWYEHNPKSAAKSTGKRNPFATPPLFETPTKSGKAPAPPNGEPLTTQLLSQFERMACAPNLLALPSPSLSGKSPFSSGLPCGPAKPSPLNFYVPKSNRIITAIDGYTENAVETYPAPATSLVPFEQYPAPATSLIPFESNEDLINGFIETFDDVYQMVCGWATTYADKINPIEASDIAKHPRAWSYMLSCLSPLSEKEASGVVGSFQRDTSTRRWFVMRMVIQYIHLNVWHYTNWLGYSEASDEDLHRICKKLLEKGIKIDERSELLTERTAVITAIQATDDYRAFRKHVIGQHAKKLRDVLPLVLNASAHRPDAGRDLAVIVTKAFDLSARLFTCGWTFIISMPEAGTRFLRSSMRARNSEVEPLELQIRQARVRFAVSPFVTLRDDSGLAIVTRNLDKASVLVEV